MDDVWKLLHVLAGFGFVAGLVGRYVSIAQARREETIGRVEALMTAAGRFERLLVIPGSAVVLVLGVATMFAQGWSFLGEGNRWLPVSVVLFLATAALVPTVFLPRGRVFEEAFEARSVRATSHGRSPTRSRTPRSPGRDAPSSRPWGS